MKVCNHNGALIAVLTRNEHCPPHVHAGTSEWDARFVFSFWHNGVELWDITPAKGGPKLSVLEDLRREIKRPANLRKARELWWSIHNTLCIDNQHWDPVSEEVVPPKKRSNTLPILSAAFDPQSYRTTLQLAGETEPLEIEL